MRDLNLTIDGMISILQAAKKISVLGGQSRIAIQVDGVDREVSDVNLATDPKPYDGVHLIYPFIRIDIK